ncbi:variant erythrocyte surface antigen-1 family protein [Babesia divergens]|uniref:Variant erythrocyte surface antigen-1 family protein n=1 Tax=Babesia divergens TaxID=32595 RepID=A0AAD9GGF7_BABDI|nr:variant erythrocyte surface antigen-1 family protein [Babesia divergens]
MVCYMYYTDVFVGIVNNINNLNKALKAELEDSELTDDLTQLDPQLNALADGLGFLAGLPACLCKTKKSVEKGLQKIYEELKTPLISCSNSKLNCDSCNSNLYPCKCCVIQSIKDVKKCECLKTPSKKCHCNGQKVSCSKVLAGLEACLHLQCLQSDMEGICQCSGSECCKGGQCDGNSPSCNFCQKLQTNTPVPTTGLGLSPPNPIRLAGRLENFFGGKGRKGSCGCKCGTSNKSCCCLACETCSSQNCSCGSNCSCAQALKLQTSQCPCKDFCIKINSIKVTAQTSLMKCCNQGAKCHCQLQKSSPCSSNCCVSQINSKYNQQSLKCMIRRLVLYFKDLNSSPDKFFKSCCDLLCVVKMCYFLGDFYDKRTQNICWTCKDGGKGGSCPSNGKCCAGPDPKCNSGFCQNCDECQQICYAKEFSRALEDLKYSSPCGQDLWRTLDAFIQYCCFVFYPKANVIRVALQDKSNGHNSKCKCNSGTCTCSSNPSSCNGCKDVLKKLQAHKDLLSLMTRGYSSAYSEASWDSLTSSISGPGSKCCGSLSSCTCQPNCSSSGSPCDPSLCCPDCPQRKAAKIFLGILPCLYYALDYLKERCKGDWKTLKISNQDSSLGRFLVGMGYNVDKELNGGKTGQEIFTLLSSSLFTSSNGPLKKLYDVSKNYFPSPSPVPSSDSDSKPKTVRDILLWLSGLPFIPQFPKLLDHCESLCSATKDSVNFNDFESSLYSSCLRSPFVLAAIQWPSKSDIFPSDSSINSDSLYPEDPFKLFETFCDFVRKIYIPLTFFYFQCKRVPGQAGWKECFFGKTCSVKPSPPVSSPSPCCPPGSGHDKYLCAGSKGHSGCSAASSSSHSSQCPHPLQAFLIDDPSSLFKTPQDFLRLDFSQSPPAILDASSDKEIFKMGFKTEQLPTPGRHGRDLYDVLNSFCGLSSSPLTKLFEFSLFVAMRPPETLIELIAFFLQFRLKLKPDLSSKFIDWISGEPGTPDGSALQKAIEKLFNSGSHPNGSSASHPYDLCSLYGCDGPKGSSPTCGRYLYPLYNVAGVFTPEFCGLYLSWVCHLGLKLHAMFQKFYDKAQKKFSKCCLSSSCPSIVKCPCALPFLYTYGFTFYQPENLNCHGHENHTSPGQGQDGCTLRSCKNFLDQLEKVANGEPFEKLLEEIEKFLWSIRFPFFFGFLYVWFFVLSYFFYVILIKLDTVHTGSHLHLPRSFKILPSTFFSDASSKLKDLSYFTL